MTEIKRFTVHTDNIKTINLPITFVEDNDPKPGDTIKIYRLPEKNHLLITIEKQEVLS